MKIEENVLQKGIIWGFAQHLWTAIVPFKKCLTNTFCFLRMQDIPCKSLSGSYALISLPALYEYLNIRSSLDILLELT